MNNIRIIGSKSYAHRALIAGALCNSKPALITNLPFCDDINSTIFALKAMGCHFRFNDNNSLYVKSGLDIKREGKFAVNESASTLRLLLPLIASRYKKSTFVLGDSLKYRPLTVYEEFFNANGSLFELEKNILTVSKLTKVDDVIHLDASISSQFVSGLLFYLPLLKKNKTTLVLENQIVSSAYIDITIKVLESFGIIINRQGNSFEIPGKQKYMPCEYMIEGDYSAASNFILYGLLKNSVEISGLEHHSLQADYKILELLKDMGVIYSFNESLKISPQSYKGFEIDIDECIDLGPVVFALGAFATSPSIIKNAKRLEYKESNRLEAMIDGLRHLGIMVNYLNAYDVRIEPVKKEDIHYDNKMIETYNDHRIIMVFKVLEKVLGIKLKLSVVDGVSKSYPQFIDILDSLE